MTRRLYLLRHAKSSWQDPSLPDHERPLAARGLRACELLRAHIESEAIVPDVVVCSTAVRTRQTLAGVESGFAAEPVTWHEQRLYGAAAEELLGVIGELPADFGSAMLVGHNPGIESLADGLAVAGEDLERLRAKFPTGALATLAFEGEWLRLGSGGAVLESFVTPRELEASG